MERGSPVNAAIDSRYVIHASEARGSFGLPHASTDATRHNVAIRENESFFMTISTTFHRDMRSHINGYGCAEVRTEGSRGHPEGAPRPQNPSSSALSMPRRPKKAKGGLPVRDCALLSGPDLT